MSTTSVTTTSKVVLKRKKSTLSEAKIAVLGDKNVGKSAIVVRFLTRRFIFEYEHGSDSRYRQELLVDNEPVIFDVLDTSSFTSPDACDTSHLHTCDVLLLVYSVIDRNSFNYIRSLLCNYANTSNQLRTSASSQMPPLIAIVGNKADLVHLRQVSTEEGEILSSEYSELSTVFLGEISAADQMLGYLFVDLFKWLKRAKKEQLHKFGGPPSLLDRVVSFGKSSSYNTSFGNGS